MSFGLPLGYAFNLDGSMMYCIFAILFIAQVLGIELPLAQQLLLVGNPVAAAIVTRWEHKQLAALPGNPQP